MTSRAPISRSQLTLRVDPVAITWAPKKLANCTAKCPTPPAPAWMSIRWPSCAFATSTTAPHAVIAAHGTPAASTWLSARGFFARLSADTATYSAYAPS